MKNGMSSIVNSFKNFFSGRHLLHSVMLLSGATAFAQAINILISPIITRLYDPHVFGIFAFYGSLATIINSTNSLSYEQAIPIAPDDETAQDLVFLGGIAIMFTSAIIMIALYFSSSMIAKWTGIPALNDYLWLVAISTLLGGTYQMLTYWAIRRKDFPLVGKTRVIQSIGSVSTQIALGIVHAGPIGLITADFLYNTSGVLGLASGFLKSFRKRCNQLPTIHTLCKAAFRYRQFALVYTPSSLLNCLGLFMPGIMMSSCFGTTEGGYLSLALRLVTLPLTLIGRSISQVFNAEAAIILRTNPNGLIVLFDSITHKTVRIGLIVIAGGAIAPFVFPIIFGEKWHQAGIYAALLAVYSACNLVVSPLSSITTILEKSGLQLSINTLRAILVTLSFYVPYKLGWKPVVSVALYSAVISLCYVLYYIAYRRLILNIPKSKE